MTILNFVKNDDTYLKRKLEQVLTEIDADTQIFSAKKAIEGRIEMLETQASQAVKDSEAELLTLANRPNSPLCPSDFS